MEIINYEETEEEEVTFEQFRESYIQSYHEIVELKRTRENIKIELVVGEPPSLRLEEPDKVLNYDNIFSMIVSLFVLFTFTLPVRRMERVITQFIYDKN